MMMKKIKKILNAFFQRKDVGILLEKNNFMDREQWSIHVIYFCLAFSIARVH